MWGGVPAVKTDISLLSAASSNRQWRADTRQLLIGHTNTHSNTMHELPDTKEEQKHTPASHVLFASGVQRVG